MNPDAILKMMTTMEYAMRVITMLSRVSIHLAELCKEHNVPIDRKTQSMIEECNELTAEMKRSGVLRKTA